MKINVSKIQTGPFLKLCCCVEPQPSSQSVFGGNGASSNESGITEELNIDNLVTVQIKFRSACTVRSEICVRKLNSAKESIVKIYMSYLEPPSFKEFIFNADEVVYEIAEGRALKVNIFVTKIKLSSPMLYEDCEFTDFKLTTDEGSVDMHKACLAAHSDVFKVMLSGQWKETASGQLNRKDVSLQTLEDLKRYMYLGTLPDNNLQLQPLLLLAMCYLMKNLKNECIMKLALMLKSEDLYNLLQFAFIYNIPELTFSILMSTSQSVLEGALVTMAKQITETNVEKNNVSGDEQQNMYAPSSPTYK